MTFGISEQNIIETGERGDMTLGGRGKENYVTLRHNQPIPNFIEDGVDSISISKEAENRYLVEYWGYLTGSYTVTRDGIEELGTTLLSDREPIPSWTISSDPDELPDWIPSDYHPPNPIECDGCGADVTVTEVLTPVFGGEYDRCCRACWEGTQ
jgi:hypothetical protein